MTQMTQILPMEAKGKFDTFEEADVFWRDQLDAVRGFKLRAAELSFDRDFDTKIEKWNVYIRWFPIPRDANLQVEPLKYAPAS